MNSFSQGSNTTALAIRSLNVVCTCCLRALRKQYQQVSLHPESILDVLHADAPHEIYGPLSAMYTRCRRHVRLRQRRRRERGSLLCEAL